MSTKIVATILLIIGLVFGSVAVALPALLPPIAAVPVLGLDLATAIALFVFQTNHPRSLWPDGFRYAFTTPHNTIAFAAGARSALRRLTTNTTIASHTAHERLGHVQRAIAARVTGAATTFALAPP